jgi:hypothetical protein
MATIISGRFDQQDATSRALEALVSAGFARERVASFFVNAPGKHDLYPVGGDEDKSPGAMHAGKGAVGGAAGAAVAGAAAGSLLGPAGAATGALVGAYVGSLPGALAESKGHAQPDQTRTEAKRTVEERHAGMMLSVEVADGSRESTAIRVLQEAGATDLERGDGHIVDGDWVDFDPLSPVRHVPAHRARASGARDQ